MLFPAFITANEIIISYDAFLPICATIFASGLGAFLSFCYSVVDFFASSIDIDI